MAKIVMYCWLNYSDKSSHVDRIPFTVKNISLPFCFVSELRASDTLHWFEFQMVLKWMIMTTKPTKLRKGYRILMPKYWHEVVHGSIIFSAYFLKMVFHYPTNMILQLRKFPQTLPMSKNRLYFPKKYLFLPTCS